MRVVNTILKCYEDTFFLSFFGLPTLNTLSYVERSPSVVYERMGLYASPPPCIALPEGGGQKWNLPRPRSNRGERARCIQLKNFQRQNDSGGTGEVFYERTGVYYESNYYESQEHVLTPIKDWFSNNYQLLKGVHEKI